MAKIDKEMLRKHHFWFMFIPITIGLIIAWCGLVFGVVDDIDAKLTDNNKQAKNAKAQAQPRKTLDVFQGQLTELDKKKLVLWKDGWEKQKDIFAWPSGYSHDQLEVVQKYKFGEEIPDTNSVRSQFAEAKVYPAEFKKLVDTLEPMQFKSLSDTSTRDENWKAVLRYEHDQNWGRTPDSEDMWLAMEDLWVQRELLLAVHKVNVAAAALKQAPSPDGKDDPKHRWFKNRTWELEMWIDEEKGGKRVLKGKLKNISPRLQVMGVGNVMQMEVEMKPEGKKFLFEVQETAIEAGQKDPMLITTIPGHYIPPELKITEIAAVRQIFDVRTIPVKEIDDVYLGYKCDRNSYMPLRANLMSLKRLRALIKENQSAAAAAALSTPTDPAAPPPPPSDDPNSVVATVANGFSPRSSCNLRRYRYLDVILAKAPGQDIEVEQMRRLPIGLVLVTDQSYMNEILESLVDIKLPLQLVQVESTRFHGSVDYSKTGAPSPGGLNPFGASPASSRDDQFSANLMQLSVYGVISLYDPYDEKPAKK